jgi:nitronate monooxygenase
MWKNTEVTRRLKLDVPIVQGPFGSGLSAVDLVVAVSEGGGLGSFGVHHLDGAGIRAIDAQIRARTRRTYALNLWIPLRDSDDPRMTDAQWIAACELLRPYFDELRVPMPSRPARFGPRYQEQIETLLELRPPVFSFVFGVPSPDVLERCRSAGIATLGAATTAAEAKLLADSGVDMIVASGFEAGGHRVSFLTEPEDCLTGTMALIPQVVDAVKVPVIAAGGIADGRGISPVRSRMRHRCIARSCSARTRGARRSRARSRGVSRAAFTTDSSMRCVERKACSRRIPCRPGSRRSSNRRRSRPIDPI